MRRYIRSNATLAQETVGACIFCRSALDGNEPVEHLIPDALGGWLKTRLVCRSCNSIFGHDVDTFVNSPMIVALRLEAGFSVPRGLEVEFTSQAAGTTLSGILEGDKTVRPRQNVYDLGSGRYLLMEKEVVKLEALRKHVAERKARRGEDMSFHGPVHAPPERVPIAVPGGPFSTDPLVDQLRREACKIAVEYVGLKLRAETALRPELDHIRAHALTGEPADDLAVEHRIVPVSLSRLQMNVIVTDSDGNREGPDSLPRLDHITHEVWLLPIVGGMSIQVGFFGCIAMQVPLPQSVPFGRGFYDRRDFTRRSTSAGYL